jgi:hypothetical protein
MLTRRKAIAGIVLLALTLCWVLPRAADAVVGNTSILFYGKVVNEAGVPVEGAEVKAQLLANDRLLVGGPIRELISAKSDAGGRFILRSNRGTSLEIQTIRRPENPDPMSMWYPSEKQRGYFLYSSFSPVPGHTQFFVPERDRPEVFQMPRPPPRPPVRLPWGVDRQ